MNQQLASPASMGTMHHLIQLNATKTAQYLNAYNVLHKMHVKNVQMDTL